MTTYVVLAMVSFEDDAASAQHIYDQIKVEMTNSSVSRIGEPGERTSYCTLGTENEDGTISRMGHLAVDQFGIVREGDPDVKDAPDWIRPRGPQDAYPAQTVRGEPVKVTHNDKIWVNTYGKGNEWEPGVFGWSEA